MDSARSDIKCNLCGSSEQASHCPENRLGLVACQDCGLVFVNSKPKTKELYSLYDQNYFHNNNSGKVGYSNYIADEANIRKTAQHRLNFLEEYSKKGRLLDVGCATGFFIDEASKRGWKAEGLDVSNFAIKYARKHFKHPVKAGSFTDLNYPIETYDLITMWDLIEHVPNPTAYANKASSLLRSGGVISLATPDIDSIPARITGKRWVGFKLSKEHLYYFSTKTLRRLLEKAGFDIINTRHIGKHVTVGLFLNRLGMYSSFIAKPLEIVEHFLNLSERPLYINPFDIVAITARKR